MNQVPGHWGAKWISYGQGPQDDMGVFVFRKMLSLSAQPERFEVRISADQRYRLFVNGKLVGMGPQRGDIQHWFYETYDLAPFLRKGNNWVVAQVWNFGRYAPMAQHTARQGLVVDGEGLATPDGWTVAKVPGWTFEMLHSLVGPFYIDVGPGEIMDAADLGWGWQEGGAGGLDWREPNVVCDAVERGGAGGGTPWALAPSTIPPMLYERRKKRPKERRPILFDYGELFTAYPRFTLNGPAGARVNITYAESFFRKDGGKGHRDEIEDKEMRGYQDVVVLDGQEREYGPLWWRTYRYIRIESDNEIEVKNIEAYETGYPLTTEGSFNAKETEQIWEVSTRTAKRCAGETYFDCPYYEQLQYVADTRIQALIGYYLSKDRSLQRNAIDQFAWSITPDGLTQSRYPSRQPQVIPPFSLWWIMMLYDQWLYDRAPVSSQHLDLAHGVLRSWERLIEGSPERAFWTFADWVPGWKWGEPPGKARSSVHIFTKWLAELALARIEGAQGRIDSIRQLLNDTERCENGLIYHPQDPVKFASEHAAALFRLCQQLAGEKPDPWPEKALHNAAKCTYYFSYYKHLAKCPADYIAELGPWYEMLDQGLTTFAESPEPTRSDCHAWSAHPILGLLQLVAGVTSVEEGWRKARIAPRPGRLQSFAATVAHPDGSLKVELKNSRLRVQSPVPFQLVWADETQECEAGEHEF